MFCLGGTEGARDCLLPQNDRQDDQQQTEAADHGAGQHDQIVIGVVMVQGWRLMLVAVCLESNLCEMSSLDCNEI